VRRLVVTAASVVLLAGCSGGDATDPAPTAPTGAITAQDPASADPLPSAELTVLGSDETVTTASWIGTPLVLNFWAEWCGPCREEMPDFEAVHQDLAGAVRFIGIDYMDRAEDAIAFADEVGVTYELVEDPDGTYFRAVRGRGTPQTLLVDADGTIRWRHAGPLDEGQLRELIATHLGVPG
jgi:cytochrome c biogenesis protein CcmG, thiol:disulfide interchange protein DsbE